MANEPARGSQLIAGIKPLPSSTGELLPCVITVDDNYSPPRLVIELPDRSLRALGTVTLNAGTATAILGAINGGLPNIYTQAMDNTGGSGTDPLYIGWAAPGSATSAAVWAIIKLTYDGNNNVSALKWAAGSIAFTNIYDNRAALSYS